MYNGLPSHRSIKAVPKIHPCHSAESKVASWARADGEVIAQNKMKMLKLANSMAAGRDHRDKFHNAIPTDMKATTNTSRNAATNKWRIL